MRICVLQPTPTNIREEFPSRCLDLRFEPTCYADIGVEGAIAKAIAQMDKLYAFLSERHIPLSVGVYPWPQQLLYDKEESRQVNHLARLVREEMPPVLQSLSRVFCV